MEYASKLIDYFMDFNKVRVFQEFCGLKVSNSVTEYRLNTCNKKTKNISNSCHQQRDLCDDNDLKKSCVNNELATNDWKKTCEVTNWFLYYLFRFGSMLGHEIFYITFIPCIFWNVDPFVARKIVVVWVVTMYIGQALKELIRWPRPTWPPVFKLETRVEAEFGIPSTHAVAGTALPFSFLMALYGRYEFPLALGIVLACSWSLLVCLSRLYVGMHSILDVIAGVALAAVYLWLGWPYMEKVEEYTMTSKYAPAIILLSHFLLGFFYPNNDRHSTSRGDTVIILGSGAGIHVGTWISYYYGIDNGPFGEPPYSFDLPTVTAFSISTARALIGFFVLILVRTVTKALSLSVVCWAVGVSKKDPQSTQRKDVEIIYKFVTYTSVGIATVVVVPYLLNLLQITH